VTLLNRALFNRWLTSGIGAFFKSTKRGVKIMRHLGKIIPLSLLALVASCGAQPTVTNKQDQNAQTTNQVGALAAESGPGKTLGALTVSEPRSRPTSSGATVAGGYLTITNAGAEADRLIRAASPRATRTELHEMAMDGNMMTMRPVTSIEVPANGSVKLEPGGFHIMFLDIPKPFAANETIPVSLTFEKAGQIDVELMVGVRAGQSGRVSDHGAKN